ncbi:MAG: protoporphyrinogen oxidase [Hyphomicrobiaceae bacterium]|nr:MAG: protoporphyrinogen oxidase [Hyphomicrobiaceae bacterium]
MRRVRGQGSAPRGAGPPALRKRGSGQRATGEGAMMADVAVIGGGISGLAAAFELKRSGRDVVVLERQVKVGGKAISERFGGFLMEHGPSSFVAECPILSVSHDLGLAAEQIGLSDAVRRRYLVAAGRLCGIGIHPAAFLTSSYLSPNGRLRLLGEVFARPRQSAGEETVAAFSSRRFGREFADRVMDPLVGGMFAGTAGRLSMTATFPRLVAMEREHGSILKAVMRARLRGKPMPGRRLLSWRNGIGTLPDALAASLGPLVRVGAAVRGIGAHPRGFLIDVGASGRVQANAIVLATQPHVAAQLLEGLEPEAASAARAIEAPPLAVVFLGFARHQIPHPLDGLGYLSATCEARPVNGGLFCSSMFAGRAPEGFVSLAVYVGGDRAPALAQLSREDLIELARKELADLLGAKGAPVMTRVRHWARGLPQYRTGHEALAQALDGASRRRPGLFITGNYLSGVSVASCVAHARKTAGEVDAFLRAAPSNPTIALKVGGVS